MNELNTKDLSDRTQGAISLTTLSKLALEWGGNLITAMTSFKDIENFYKFNAINVIGNAVVYAVEEENVVSISLPNSITTRSYVLPSVTTKDFLFRGVVVFYPEGINGVTIRALSLLDGSVVWLRLPQKRTINDRIYEDYIEIENSSVFSGFDPKDERDCALQLNFNRKISTYRL